MSYNGISTRELSLERHLEAVIANHCANPALFCGTCTAARKALDAKCGLATRGPEKKLTTNGSTISFSVKCVLPSGHSGSCYGAE